MSREERRVLGWVGGGALGLATYGGIEAATFGALTGPQILIACGDRGARAGGAVLGFFVGFRRALVRSAARANAKYHHDGGMRVLRRSETRHPAVQRQ